MVTLGIDTATSLGSVGIAKDGDLAGELSFSAKMSQAERLLPTIDDLLNLLAFDRREIEKVAVSLGPGSFTGLRIGISVAKGLCHGLEVPLTGIPLTDSYHERVAHYRGPICTIIADRRDLVYYALYRKGEKARVEKSDHLSNLKEELKETARAAGEKVLLIGDGLTRHGSELQGIKEAILAEHSLNYPSGAQLALQAELQEDEGDQLRKIEPLYAQRPVAEINFEKRNST